MILQRIISLGLVLTLSGVGGGPVVLAKSPQSEGQKGFTPDKVKPHVVILADDALEGRGAGYPGERKAANYVASVFKKTGLQPVGDEIRGVRSYFQEFSFQAMHPTVPWQLLRSRNVLGLIEGDDPVLKKEIVVVGAHYDGQGRIGQADGGPRFGVEEAKTAKDDIWNSADDNAASVAALLEIARAIKSQRVVTKRSILFIAFGAEEHGLDGSIHYVTHPAFPLGNHVAMINLEKLGRSPDKPFSINAIASSSAWPEIIKAAQEQTQTRVIPNVPINTPDSDHYAFNASRIPAVMLYMSATPAHFANDTSDRIDYARVAQAAGFSMVMVLDLATRANRPSFVDSPVPDLGLIAHLATNEEADAKGLRSPEAGLKVTGVLPGFPAAVAGLQPGDFIVEFAGYKFHRDDKLAALMSFYRELLQGKRGDVLMARVIRGGQGLDMTLNLRH